MFATAGSPGSWSCVTQSMPATTCDVLPEPWQFRTRTATRFTCLATPYVEPPIVPATCVPWPWQSSALPPSIASNPLVARPPNSWCENRIPVSITYAVTPLPVAVYVYALSTGSERWSIRSRPQVAGVCVWDRRTTASCSTYATRGSRLVRSACARDMSATNPFNADENTRCTLAPYARCIPVATNPGARGTGDRSTTM